MHYGGSGSGSNGNEPYNIYTHHLRDKEYDIDSLSGVFSDYYYREESRSSTHDVVGKPLLVQQDFYDYQPELPSWIFYENVDYQGDDETEITLSFCSNVEGYISLVSNKVRKNHQLLRSI